MLASAKAFTGPNSALPLRSGNIQLRSAAVCTKMHVEEPSVFDVFRKRASSFVAGLVVSSSLVTGTPAIIEPAYAAKNDAAVVEDSLEAQAENAGQRAKKAAERAALAKKQLEKDIKEAENKAMQRAAHFFDYEQMH